MTKQPQFHLYLLTLNLLGLKNQVIQKNCDERCINATIINRAYYSSYLYCELWLEKVHKFKVRPPWEFKPNEKKTGEHKQVRNALKDFGKNNVKTSLQELASLRRIADYYPYEELTLDDVSNAISYMEKIFSHLKFE